MLYCVRDCQQISFVMLNKFCLLSKPPTPSPSPPCPSQAIANWIEYQPKLNEKYITTFFTLYFKFWRYILLIKICKIKLPDQIFYFFLFLLAFTSAGIIFLKLLEFHLKISEKYIFVTNFAFWTDSLRPPPTPLMTKICYVWQKFFVYAP